MDRGRSRSPKLIESNKEAIMYKRSNVSPSVTAQARCTENGTRYILISWHGHPRVDAVIEGACFRRLTSAELATFRSAF